ncbi:unnamed protein product [Spirodela intermedia]|uniref:Uncharacterized protein n=1 Tax=Spirodela intermedia TaxID=51605 RepID=A0A7I8J934_SPIIN|nr:unnamed protein product [Spirodela intermedia]CAA6666697.1 unnamed protein product [Spirodela intermedia]
MPEPDRRPQRRPPCLVQSFRRLCAEGRLEQAVGSLPLLARRGIRLDAQALALLLQQCLRSRAVGLARRVNLHLKLTGFKNALPSKTFLANQVLNLHFERRRPADAQDLFDRMLNRNVFTYNVMLAGFAKLGMVRSALQIFERMRDGDRDVVSWNTMIATLARGGSCREAVEFYARMRRSSGIFLNHYSFSGLLAACVRLEQTDLAQQTHGQVIVIGYLSNLIISSSIMFSEMPARDVLTWTTLVSGYAKCGDLVSARRLFDEMPERNNLSWTAMIRGYARNGLSHEALHFFAGMLKEGVSPDQFSISSALCACANISSLNLGRQIHALLTRTLSNPNAVVIGSLLDMYCKCGCLEESQRIFDHTTYRKRDTVP